MKNTLLVLSIATLLFSSCDYIDFPVEEGGGGNPIDTTTGLRKVLLEDFTGHYCANCPSAANVAKGLHNLYGDQLIVVAVHAGPSNFVNPQNNPDGSYATDFRTAAGDAYAQTFSINALPKGMVSRREFNSSITLSSASWGPATAEIINEDAIMTIEFEEVDYSSSNNTISTTINVEALEELNGDHRCVIYLIEDDIIDWQLDNTATPEDVPDYEHDHVLRDNLTGAWGDIVFSGTVSAGTTETVVVNGFSVNTDWDMDKSYLVAYVYDDSTSEIWQVEKAPVK